jgi:hypothetical protein
VRSDPCGGTRPSPGPGRCRRRRLRTHHRINRLPAAAAPPGTRRGPRQDLPVLHPRTARWRTDLDHTLPWHKGGLTCTCNIGGCCRTHLKIKQLPGWSLQQPRPGVCIWTTPAGRSYQVRPDPYPV